MSERIATDVVADILANVATEPPWRVLDENHARHVVDTDGNVLALDVGDDAPLLAAAPDLAADVIDARRELSEERARREAAEATVERSRAHLRRSMDAMMEAPGMFGDDAAVEVLMLVSLGALRVIERPHAPPRFVMDAFIAFAHRKFPRMGALGLSGYLRRIGRSAELPALMAEFRAEVEASWAVSR